MIKNVMKMSVIYFAFTFLIKVLHCNYSSFVELLEINESKN